MNFSHRSEVLGTSVLEGVFFRGSRSILSVIFVFLHFIR